jgi:hypothetical protein
MKSFKHFVEEKKFTHKEVSPLQGLVATMPETVMTADKISVDIIDKAIKKNSIGESAEMPTNQKKALEIGRKMQAMAAKEKNDMIANAMAKLGDHLETFGATFGPKNMDELVKKTGLTKELISMLIKRTQK